MLCCARKKKENHKNAIIVLLAQSIILVILVVFSYRQNKNLTTTTTPTTSLPLKGDCSYRKLSLQWDVIVSTLHHYKKFCVVVNNKKANKIEGKYLVNKQSHTIKFLSSHDRHSSVFFIFFVVQDRQHISDKKGQTLTRLV